MGMIIGKGRLKKIIKNQTKYMGQYPCNYSMLGNVFLTSLCTLWNKPLLQRRKTKKSMKESQNKLYKDIRTNLSNNAL